MSDMSSLWVLGHKIRLIDTDDSYGAYRSYILTQSAGTSTALS